MHRLTDSFLLQCREHYARGVTPSGPGAASEQQALVAWFRGFTAANGVAAFTGFLQEGQYYSDLWAAHLLVEHHRPDEPTRRRCLDTIERYANSPVNPQVAQEERAWLKSQA